MSLRDRIESDFTYHPPRDDNQRAMYIAIRNEAKALAYLIDSAMPDGREKSLAVTKLEEVVFWTNAGIARGEE